MDSRRSSSFLLLLFSSCPLVAMAAMDACYDDEGLPSRCMPKFENAAFNRTIMASNTCGSPPEDYCMQTGSTRFCHNCNMSDPARHHNATYLTDFHSDEEPSWWQSQSMFYGVQHPNSVNLTLHLGKDSPLLMLHVGKDPPPTLTLHLGFPPSLGHITPHLSRGASWLVEHDIRP